MAGKRARGGTRSMEELIRLACSTDPEVPVSRPRRLALAPRAAMVAGAALVALAVVLAVHGLAATPTGAGTGAGTARATSSAPVAGGGTATAGDPGAAPTGLAPQDPLAAPGGDGTAPGSTVVVHVTGAVASPGVVTLPAGARVVEAVHAAGGAAVDADTSLLNLARVLVDGEQVRVPRQGEEVADPAGTSGGPAGGAGGGTPGAAGGGSSGTGLVDVNTADAAALETLPGIGPALAQRIIDYRQANGPFASVDDLQDVPGIGPAKLEALREAATV